MATEVSLSLASHHLWSVAADTPTISMEVAIIVIVVFVILLLAIIAIVRFCNKFDCCGCCDSGDESMDEVTEGRDSDTMGEDDGMGDDDLDEEEILGTCDDDDDDECEVDYSADNQVAVDMEGEEYIVNKMEESLL